MVEKKNLERLLQLLPALLEAKGNEWFKDELYNQVVLKYYPLSNFNQGTIGPNLQNDEVIRLRAYFKLVDKKALNYGREFYKQVTDQTLKKQLIQDFREMKIALRGDDIVGFGRFMGLQMENCFNFILNKIDVWSYVIQNNHEEIRIGLYPPIKLFNIFMENDRYTNSYKNKKLDKVPLNYKLEFFYKFYSCKPAYDIIHDIFFLRNKGSHRGILSSDDQRKLDRIMNGFDKNISMYYSNFEEIISKMNDLYN